MQSKTNADPTKFEWGKPQIHREIFEIRDAEGRYIKDFEIAIDIDKSDLGTSLDIAIADDLSIAEKAFDRYDTEHENGPRIFELIVYAKALVRGYIYRLELTREATWEYGCEIHEYK